jgi:hypothetical protein
MLEHVGVCGYEAGPGLVVGVGVGLGSMLEKKVITP